MDQLESILREFADRIRDQVRTEIVAAIGTVRGAPSWAGSGRPVSERSRPKGAKRDPRALAELTAKLASTIKGTPGKRIEEIGKAMGVHTKDLALPAKKLLAAKAIRTTGNRRATKYYPK